MESAEGIAGGKSIQLGKVAIVGANGFVGSRMVEMLHLSGIAEVVPVVRSVSSLARLARFDLSWRLADACDADSLAKAVEGCDAVVHAVVGDPKVVEAAAGALYRASRRSQVRRIVYLSTASVHGLNPAAGTTEDSPLSDRQPFVYNNAKVRAERTLRQEHEGGSVELVIIRPGIVFGPRDRWVSVLVHELMSRTAWLVGGGAGVCNSIYVDNLVHAVSLALSAPKGNVDGRAFLVGDAEPVTWRQFYFAAAHAAGIPTETIHLIRPPQFPKPGVGDWISGLRSSGPVQSILPLVPSRFKDAAKGALRGWVGTPAPDPWSLPTHPAPAPSRELVALQQCAYRLPWTRAAAHLGYAPPVSFDEGMRRTIEWLRWSGWIR